MPTKTKTLEGVAARFMPPNTGRQCFVVAPTLEDLREVTQALFNCKLNESRYGLAHIKLISESKEKLSDVGLLEAFREVPESEPTPFPPTHEEAQTRETLHVDLRAQWEKMKSIRPGVREDENGVRWGWAADIPVSGRPLKFSELQRNDEPRWLDTHAYKLFPLETQSDANARIVAEYRERKVKGEAVKLQGYSLEYGGEWFDVSHHLSEASLWFGAELEKYRIVPADPASSQPEQTKEALHAEWQRRVDAGEKFDVVLVREGHARAIVGDESLLGEPPWGWVGVPGATYTFVSREQPKPTPTEQECLCGENGICMQVCLKPGFYCRKSRKQPKPEPEWPPKGFEEVKDPEAVVQAGWMLWHHRNPAPEHALGHIGSRVGTIIRTWRVARPIAKAEPECRCEGNDYAVSCPIHGADTWTKTPPATGEECEIAGANSDTMSGHAFSRAKALHIGKEFGCFQVGDCWPFVERLSNCWFRITAKAEPVELCHDQFLAVSFTRVWQVTGFNVEGGVL